MNTAIIFDMNGVIINDEKFHNQSWVIFCKNHNFTLSQKEFETEVMGKRDKETLDYLFKKIITAEELSEYGDERDDIVRELVKGKLELTHGLLDFLIQATQANIPLAIATSSRAHYMNFIVDNFDIRKFFSVIVTGDDVENGKPDPEIYLKTAGLLHVDPKNCVVFEDSLAGIKAASEANMKVIAITTTHSREELRSANLIIDDFDDINQAMLATL